MRKMFTSEAVCIGHPDKVCDQIADAILDAHLTGDPYSRVACEVAVKTGLVLIMGEITSRCTVDYMAVARQTIQEIGYTDPEIGFDFNSCGIILSIEKQSGDIAMGVDGGKGKPQGAGDQGMMFGYACTDTPNYMPLTLELARRICTRLREARETKELPWLRPDGKAQVTIEYEDDKPIRVRTVVCSAQHRPEIDIATLRKELIEKVVKKVIPPGLLDGQTEYLINPTGRFVQGGPKADSGLTGRKIVADTYGGVGHHGGGAFSGKDPTKVDRSAAYAARHAAKNIVAAGLAERCEVALAYAIGHPTPLMVDVNTYGTGRISDAKLSEIAAKVFDFTPAGMIDYYKLRRPIYKNTARNGHFGVEDPDHTWERLEKVPQLQKLAGLTPAKSKTKVK